MQRVQELDGVLGLRRGVEHCQRLVLERLRPRADVARVVRPRRRGGAQERAAELRDQLLAGILGRARRTEVAVAAASMPATVRVLVREGGPRRMGRLERLERRHLDAVGTRRVVGALTAVADGGGERMEPRFTAGVALVKRRKIGAKCVDGIGTADALRSGMSFAPAPAPREVGEDWSDYAKTRKRGAWVGRPLWRLNCAATPERVTDGGGRQPGGHEFPA